MTILARINSGKMAVVSEFPKGCSYELFHNKSLLKIIKGICPVKHWRAPETDAGNIQELKRSNRSGSRGRGLPEFLLWLQTSHLSSVAAEEAASAAPPLAGRGCGKTRTGHQQLKNNNNSFNKKQQ